MKISAFFVLVFILLAESGFCFGLKEVNIGLSLGKFTAMKPSAVCEQTSESEVQCKENNTIANVSTLITYNFKNKKLHEIIAQFPQDKLQNVKTIIEGKYGSSNTIDNNQFLIFIKRNTIHMIRDLPQAEKFGVRLNIKNLKNVQESSFVKFFIDEDLVDDIDPAKIKEAKRKAADI